MIGPMPTRTCHEVLVRVSADRCYQYTKFSSFTPDSSDAKQEACLSLSE